MDQLTFGAELRRLREQRGLSLTKFAKRVHYDPGYLSKIENGLKPPTGALATKCDEVLGTCGQLTELASGHAKPTRQHQQRSGNPPAPYLFGLWGPGEVANHALQLTGFDLALSRREALVDGATTLAGGALLGPLQNWLFPLSSGSGSKCRGLGVAQLPTFLFTRQAWAFAHLNRPRDFSRAVGQAEDLFTETNSASCPAWLADFDEAELFGVLGARYRDLASTGSRHARLGEQYILRAEQYILRALSLRAADRIRNRTFDLIGLARTYLVMGEPEQGCLIARHAVKINDEVLHGRPKRKLQDFCRELLPYSHTVAGRDFSEYLRHLRN